MSNAEKPPEGGGGGGRGGQGGLTDKQAWSTPADALGSSDSGGSMEINNRIMPHNDVPAASLLYMHNAQASGLSEEDIQAQLINIQKQYQLQASILNQQFEERQRVLAQEQQLKMQEYLKAMMVQKQQQQQQQQQEYFEQQQKLQAHQMHMERVEKEKLMQIKNKGKEEESAVASNEVKQKLRECLLNKSQRDVNHMKSPPDFRHWATQHSSLEQHSPPTSGMSPPLRAHLLGKYDEDYPLRKTASEPNLKVRLALKQKMIERRSSPLLRRKERYSAGAKRGANPLAIDTTGLCDSNPDSGPNTPPSSSAGSQGETPQKEEAAAFPLQMMSKMVNQSMPNISIGQPRDKVKAADSLSASASVSLSEAELRARMAAQYGMPLTSHGSPGSLPYFPLPVDAEGGPTSPAYIDAQMKMLELACSTGQLPQIPGMMGLPLPMANPASPTGIAEAHAAHVRLQRPPLNRTNSAPLPLPTPLLWSHHLLLQKQQQELIKETQKHYLKQRLQSTLLQRSGSKNHMENVDEEAEARLAQEMKETREQREDNDVVIIDDAKSESQQTKDREAFLLKYRQRTVSSGSPPVVTSSRIPPKPLERAQSSPSVSIRQSSTEGTSSPPTYSTGFAFDSLMLKHQCQCGDNSLHPEHPGRLQSIYARLQESGLLAQCEKLKSRKATLEELQTCHSEAYTLLYGSSPDKLDPKVFETMVPLPRFRLSCGGIGVDSDTVWHETYTPQASRVAAGCAIELAFKVASGDVQNGFAVVRPPGHHAEPTQPMGFCFFNSIAVAAKLLLNKLQMKKILLVDWDVHHGNSTQQIFYADPRVLYISLHRHDSGNFFPGTGAPEDRGIERGMGYNVNIAFSGSLSPPMGDAEYMAAFRTIVMPIAREFQPEIVLVSAGFDAAAGHPSPLGGYQLSAACFGQMTKQLMTLAGGRLCLVLEGGYELKSICDASEICLRALLGEEVPMISEEELCRKPNHHAVETIENTFKWQVPYWPCLARYSHTIDWSMVTAQQMDEADTVSAFASLSVVPEKPAREAMANNEPMEEA